MLSSTTNSLLVPGSQTPRFPVPQPHAMTPNGPTLRPPSPSPQSSSGHSGPSSPMPSFLSLHNPPTASSSSLGCDKAAAQREQIRDIWVDAEGEIPIFDKDDESWTPIGYGPLASKNSGGGNSWTDGYGVLLNNYFMILEEASPTTRTKSSHMIQPIPLDCLRLVPLRDGSEVRKQKRGFFKSIGSCFRSLPTEDVYPLTVFHAAAKITRRHTVYTKSAMERNRWHNELTKAVEVCQARQPGIELYQPHTLDNTFFCVPPPRIQLTRGRQFTGRALCVAEFSYQGGHYLAVGCTNGIYVSDRASDSREPSESSARSVT
ncbi:hypothetical protein BJV74DRAFT_818572 [Russula compacta]|nr:hypothetical protein BJV74DRAFT_818572 [Russula compacta]